VTECAQVEANGFAVLPHVFAPDRVDSIVGEITQLSPHHSRAGVRHALSLTPVAKIAHSPELMRIASHVLGENVIPFRATLFEKTLTANWLVVWHQDTALPLRERREIPGWGPWSVKEGINYAHAPVDSLSKVLALRIHFDDSGSDNGPLRVLPTTHQLGVLSDDQIGELSKRIEAVDCVAPKGGVIAMRPLVVHASSKSRTEVSRRVLHIEYAESESIASPLRLAFA